jgi:hypothetical protein
MVLVLHLSNCIVWIHKKQNFSHMTFISIDDVRWEHVVSLEVDIHNDVVGSEYAHCR